MPGKIGFKPGQPIYLGGFIPRHFGFISGHSGHKPIYRGVQPTRATLKWCGKHREEVSSQVVSCFQAPSTIRVTNTRKMSVMGCYPVARLSTCVIFFSFHNNLCLIAISCIYYLFDIEYILILIFTYCEQVLKRATAEFLATSSQ